MPVIASELVWYGAANHAEDDTSTQGGGISTTTMVVFTPLAANDAIEALSSSAADTMNLTVTGRNAAGEIVSETKALNGTTTIDFTTLGTIERVLKIVLASPAAGTVTVRRDAAAGDIVAMAPGILTVRRLFYDAASESGSTTRYEKFFVKNTNGTNSLTNAQIELTSDPGSTIRVGCAPSVDDTATVTNRKTAPGSVTFVDDGVPQSIPGGNLAAGSAIAVWSELVRGSGAAPIKTSFEVTISGTST